MISNSQIWKVRQRVKEVEVVEFHFWSIFMLSRDKAVLLTYLKEYGT